MIDRYDMCAQKCGCPEAVDAIRNIEICAYQCLDTIPHVGGCPCHNGLHYSRGHGHRGTHAETTRKYDTTYQDNNRIDLFRCVGLSRILFGARQYSLKTE
jgi:hypothetical protein